MGRPLLWFPYNVNNWLTRLVGILVCAFSCCLPIIFRKEPAMHFACAAFTFDFILRFVGGARMSVLGHIAEVIMVLGQSFGRCIGKEIFPRELITGPPKQFAAFCGICMSGIATILLFVDSNVTRWIGGALFCVLAVLSGLEGFLGICAGCIMFDMTYIGVLIKPTSMNYCNEVYDEMERQAHEFDDRVDYPSPTSTTYQPPGYKLGLTTRAKKDPYYRQNFDPIRHITVGFFAIPLSVVGLAAVYRLRWDQRLSPKPQETAKEIWIVLAIFAAALFAIVTLLNLIRLIRYPQKAIKDWYHPIKFPAHSLFPLTILMFAFVLIRQTKEGGPIALFWIGGPLQMFLAAVFVARLLKDGYYRCWMLPVWLLAPVGTLISATVCASVRPSSQFLTELSWFFWAFGIFMWIPIFTMSFQRISVGGHLPDFMRPQVTFFMATPAVACIAYVTLNGGLFDQWARTLYFISIGFLMVNLVLLTKYFYGRDRFSIAYWAYGFSLDTVALATLLYYAAIPSKTTEVMAWIMITLATGMNVLLGGITVVELIRGHLLLPEMKFGPFQFLRATHYALRHSTSELVQLLGFSSFSLDSADFSQQLDRVASLFEKIEVTHGEHALHEDRVLFPSIQAVWPGCPALGVAGSEHQRDSHDSHTLHAAFATLRNAAESKENKQAALDTVKTLVKDFVAHINEHIDHEEDNLAGFQRKPHGCKLQKHLVRKMWKLTTGERWRVYIDLVMNHSPLHQYRLAFLKSLTVVLPERSEIIGMMVYNSVSGNLWSRLLDDVPEIIPHGLPGYRRFW